MSEWLNIFRGESIIIILIFTVLLTLFISHQSFNLKLSIVIIILLVSLCTYNIVEVFSQRINDENILKVYNQHELENEQFELIDSISPKLIENFKEPISKIGIYNSCQNKFINLNFHEYGTIF